jgi:hypothetical protein
MLAFGTVVLILAHPTIALSVAGASAGAFAALCRW